MKNITRVFCFLFVLSAVVFPTAVFGQTGNLSGVYTLQGHTWTLTFTGSNFAMFISDANQTISGSFAVSGTRVTLTSTSSPGFAGSNTRVLTVVNATTLRDWDGDLWVTSAAASASPAPAASSSSLFQYYTTLSAGASHSMFAKSDGSLLVWGANNLGQLGNGTTNQLTSPTRIGTAANWSAVSSGGGGDAWRYSGHAIALRADGSLWAWGNNERGATGLGTTTGTANTPTRIGTDSNWAIISAGGVHNLAIRRDGSLWSWGENGNGRTGLGISNDTFTTTPTRIGTDTDWLLISAGDNHSMAIKRNGTLWAWGANSSGKLGDGTTTQRSTPVQVGRDTDWAFVSAGDNHTLAIKSNGTLWAWGSNTVGQLGNGSEGSGNNSTSPIQIGRETNWASVSAGGNMSGAFSVGIRTDGSLWAWGSNISGRTGLGTTTGNTTAPARVGTAANWIYATAGSNYTIAVRNDGTFWAWGSNANGRLGDGTTAQRTAPAQVIIP